MSTARADRIPPNASTRQRIALHEMAVIVEVVSRMPQTEQRDAHWWAAVREEVCRRNDVTHLSVKQVDPPPALPQLSNRQLDVLQLMADGHTYKSAAAELGLKANSVKTHMFRTLHMLGVHSTAHAVATALRAEMIG